MSLRREFEDRREGRENPAQNAGQNERLEQALKNFRLSVHAWSEAELSRPRTMAMTVRQRSWRLALGWAMGCVLVVGGASGALYERHQHQLEISRIAAQRQADRAAEQARQMAALKAREDEDLLAKVDSDVSQEVPAAMEPLAQLMADGGNQ
ncbi:MAG: hypothetical protein WBE76_17390 [Terracidiphilus sp.]